MNDANIVQKQPWLKNCVITMLAVFACSLFKACSSLNDAQSSNNYPLLALGWILAAFFITFWLANSIGVNWPTFGGFVFICAIVIGIYQYFIPAPQFSNYNGIQYRESNEVEFSEDRFGREQSQDVHKYRRGKVYHRDSAVFKSDFDKLAKDYEDIYVKSFIFWQTGVAFGFSPEESLYLKRSQGFFQVIWMVASIGPFVLAEVLVRSLIPHFFILFILRYFLYLKRPDDPWWVIVK